MEILFLLSIILNLILSGLISGAEVAFFSLKPDQIEDFRKNDRGNDKIVLALLSNPKKLLANILIVNNLCNINIVIITTVYMWSIAGKDNYYIVFVMTLIITVIIVFGGEIIPKIWAKSNNVSFATGIAPLLNFLFSITTPLSLVLVFMSKHLEKYLKKGKPKVHVESVLKAVDLVVENKTPDEKIQDKWLKHAVTFSGKMVVQIMTSRVHVKALDIRTKDSDVIKYITEWGHSRIPVYNTTADRIEGILYAKDFLKYINQEQNFENVEWQKLVRKDPIFVTYNKNIRELLQDFQSKKTHIAIAVDEFGGTLGLVTMEDIVEEIIGEIEDEFPDNNDLPFYKKVNDNTFIFESYTSLNDFCKTMKTPTTIFDGLSKDIESLGGLILEIVASLPKEGERISYKDFLFTIEAADNKKISKIKVQIIKSLTL